jgi:hypothetical protein
MKPVNHGYQRKRRCTNKGIGNICNKIIAENFPYLERKTPIRYRRHLTLNKPK